MNFSSSKFIKAALINAAFFISFQAAAVPNSFENIKNKAADLLAQKKKDQAIRLIVSYSRTERSRPFKKETAELLFLAGQTFLSKEAQEEYETSVNATLEKEKAAAKAADRCLALEPQNLDCLIQSARIHYRAKNEKSFRSAIEKIRELLANTQYEFLFGLYLEKRQPEFRSRQINLNLRETASERMLPFVLLELDRSFSAKNFSRAKDIMLFLEKNFSDWPDLLFYKNRLNLESEENISKAPSELLAAYASKCKNMTKSASRKFRYDFELCARGEK